MSQPQFEGWLGLDADSVKGNMKWQPYAPKDWEETDVDIKISHCGICGSDIHTLRSGWVRYYSPSLFLTLSLSNVLLTLLPLLPSRVKQHTPCAWATK